MERPTALVGLALSGGGIRSATFSLGVLQGLDSLRLLHVFDYLSTVSGGGFAGGWWTAWLSRGKVTRAHVRAPRALARKLVDDALVPWPPGAAPRDVTGGGTARNRLITFTSQAMQSFVDRFVTPGRARRPLDGVLEELARVEDTPSTARAELERKLEDAVVDELNDLVEHRDLASHPQFAGLTSTLPARRGRNLDLLFTRYPDELARMFPRAERLDSERGLDYRDVSVPDGAIAAGADPLHHLRLFANYLTPRKGLLSPDTWRAAAVVSRNLMLTWLLLLPVLMALIFAGQLLFFVLPPYDETVVNELFLGLEGFRARATVAARPIGVLLGLIVAVTVLWMHRNNDGNTLTQVATAAGLGLMIGGLSFALVLPRDCVDGFGVCVSKWWYGPSWGFANWAWVALTLLLGLILLAWIRINAHVDGMPIAPARQVEATLASRWHGYLLTTLAFALALFALSGFGHEVMEWAFRYKWTKVASSAMGAAAGIGALFTALKSAPAGGRDAGEFQKPSRASRAVFAVTPVLVLVVMAVASAWLARIAITWTFLVPGLRIPVLTMIAVAGIGVCLVFAAYELGGGMRDAPPGLSRWFALGTLVAVILVALAFGRRAGGRDWQNGFSSWLFIAGLAVDLLLAAIGLRQAERRGLLRGRVKGLIVIATAAPLVIGVAAAGFPTVNDNDRALVTYIVLVWLTIAVMWVIALGWMADPNALALHSFYKARLVRAFLGASNPRRRNVRADINDPAPEDDVPLAALRQGSELGGPYHLINTTLNLVGGRDLTTAQRSAAAFVLSPLFCGSVRTGYRATTEYMRGAMTLGAAITASGAAASPNMGSRTPSAALAMLLAFFNIRLGLWVPSPHFPYWHLPQARVWPYYLLRESLSQTNDLVSYCYLTDGGHFDNTGLYPLVERGCRYIVVVDDGADPEPCFEDMGDAIRRCRIDFGTEITLDASGFRKTSGHLVAGHEVALASITLADGKKATVHYAVGTVRYATAHLRTLGRDADAREASGTIIWIKPTITGDESVDVTQYSLQNGAFPQQSTADQWFDEAQFESYRRLGYHSIEHAFTAAMKAMLGENGTRGALGLDKVGALFEQFTARARTDAPPERLRATVRLE
ncbi:MAG TPA: patatin-like phospholipase family protein [Methylomirabilota bacterium]|nr:patatin-like phospholipase family protein [Methylomirabilota bacterium]